MFKRTQKGETGATLEKQKAFHLSYNVDLHGLGLGICCPNKSFLLSCSLSLSLKKGGGGLPMHTQDL